MPDINPQGLSKLPLGLLGFFGIKNGGQYPQQVAGFHQPVIDTTGLLQAAYGERIVVSISAGFVANSFLQGNVVATGLAAAVPAGETWAVWAASFGVFTGAGDAWLGSPAVKSFQTGSGSSWTRILRDPVTQAASLTTLQTTIVQGDHAWLWLTPGDQIGFNIQTFTNASATLTPSIHLGILRFQL